MTVETATYVTGLNSSLPSGGQNLAEGDDHLRLLKAVLLASFPSIAGAVTASHAELNQLDGVTLGNGVSLNVNVANGLATLGSDSKISATYLPDSVVGALMYKGTWNASANSPAIPAAAGGNKGYYYVVATSGTTAIDGISDWQIGDWIVSNGTVWEKIDNSDKVSSVAGKTGIVTLGTADISGLGTIATQAASSVAITGGTIDGVTLGNAVAAILKAYKDTVYTITDGAAFEIDPANGTIQTVALGASRTPKATNLASGQAVVLGIDDGTSYTITWTDSTLNPTWLKVGGSGAAPSLATTGKTWVMIFKVGTAVYAVHLGDG